MPDHIRDILSRAGHLAGTDLISIFEKRKSVESEVDRIRKELPNTQTKKRFDRELDKQVSRDDRRKQKQRDVYRNRKSNKRALQKLERKLRAEGIKNPQPKMIPAHIHKQTQHILADPSGWASRYYSKLCWHKIGVSMCHRAALCYDEKGKPKYSYIGNSREAQRARFVLASGLMLLCLSRPTGRRKQGWTRLISGIPQKAILSALRDPFTGKRPSLSAFNGTHHKLDDKDLTDGNIGYLPALKRIGMVYTRQVKTADKNLAKTHKGWADIRPEEMLGKRTATGLFCSLARYWVVADLWLDPVDAEKRAKLWVAYCSSQLPEPVEFNAERFSPTETEQNVTSQARASPD